MSATKIDEESGRTTPMMVPARPAFADRIGNPAPLAMGGFAVTLSAVSLAMMGLRGVSTQTAFIGDLCFVACVGLLISAQWEMVKGNTFSYTVLSAYGLFYGGYGAMLAPTFGIADSYGGFTPQYYNAMGLFILLWAVLNIFFLIASVTFNIVYIMIFITLELCLIFDASAWLVQGDGNIPLSNRLMLVSGVWGFIASMLGFYTVLHYLCQEALPFPVPMGDTSHYFKRRMQKRLD